MKTSWSSKWFDAGNTVFLILLAVITLYPFWDSLVISIIPLEEYINASIHWRPHTIDLEAYAYLLEMPLLWTSYGNAIFVTVVGTAINMLITIMTAYALSKQHLRGRGLFMILIIFTMMFSGGIIPNYIIVKNLGMLNSLWSLIIPSAINTFNMIVLMNFFFTVPESLEESAKIDGCNDLGILFRIVIPLSMPAIATITLFYAVGRWNEYFNAVLYITEAKKWTLQVFLRAMLFENQAAAQSGGDSPSLLGEPIKMATVMISTIPVLLIYPFFQKHFVKGVTLGGVKE
ncbi:carbohydrate ABC transporter permease [Paenibacillus sp. HJGM_3]|uniref:carbohydrate ABC transporter permease n=1 Tax=Paenibacillus sp. HJGM_3 TaxID=3379816 RepID=UPI00385B44B1